MNNPPRIKLPDLTKLSMEELDRLHWEISEDAYQRTQPIRDESWKRIENKKKEQENLKKAS